MIYKSDKLLNGMIAGSIASIIKSILTVFPEFVFHLHPSFFDYAHYWIFQEYQLKHKNLLISVFMDVSFGVFTAIVYTYLKDYINTRYIILKSAIFGLMIWFTFRAIITLDKVKELAPKQISATVFSLCLSLIYGLVLGYCLKWLENKENKNK